MAEFEKGVKDCVASYTMTAGKSVLQLNARSTLNDWAGEHSVENIKNLFRGHIENGSYLKTEGSYTTKVYDLGEVKRVYVSVPIKKVVEERPPFTLSDVVSIGKINNLFTVKNDNHVGSPLSVEDTVEIFIAHDVGDFNPTEFVKFTPGFYTARYFRLKIALKSSDNGLTTPQVYGGTIIFTPQKPVDVSNSVVIS